MSFEMQMAPIPPADAPAADGGSDEAATAAFVRVLQVAAGLSAIRVRRRDAAARPPAPIALPSLHLAAVPDAPAGPVVFCAACEAPDAWIGAEDEIAVLRAPPGGGTVIATCYDAAGFAGPPFDIDVVGLEPPGRRSADPGQGSPGAGPRLTIDVPAVERRHAGVVRGSFDIRGTALAPQGIAALDLFIDGQRGPAAHRLGYPEIAVAGSGLRRSIMQKYCITVPALAMMPGEHALRVELRDLQGGVAAKEFAVTARLPNIAPWALRRKMAQSEIALQQRLLAALEWQPEFLLLLTVPPGGDAAARARLTLESLVGQAYRSWRLALRWPEEPAAAAALRAAFGDDRILLMPADGDLGLPDGLEPGADLFATLQAGEELACDALLEMALASGLDRRADFFYSDERRPDPRHGEVEPYFKPEWSPDLLLSTNYVGRFWAARMSLLRRIDATLGELARFGEYDLVLLLTEAASGIRHVPRLLCERDRPLDAAAVERRALERALARGGVAAAVLPGRLAGIHRVRRAVRDPGLVSILVPTCGKAGLFRTCIETLRARTAYRNFEIVAIDNIPVADPAAKTWLRANADRVVDLPGPFNWSRFNNRAAAQATGAFLLFLNDDIEIIEPEWLEALLEHAQRPEVGVVGALLLYPDRRVQHAGMFLSPTNRVGEHAFRFAGADDPGPFGTMLTQRNVIGVTGACMLVRRAEFERAGGFEEAHAIVNGDLDYCLRSWRDGRRVVFTPYARLIHHERASRKELGEHYDAAAFSRSWRDLFVEGDPYFSPLLADSPDYAPDLEPVRLVHAGRPLFCADRIGTILAIKLDQIGDFVTAFPALRRLRQHFPRARIVLLTTPSAAQLARLQPGVDEIIEFLFFYPKSSMGRRLLTPAELSALEARLRPYRFDLAIDLRKHRETRPLLQLSGARWLAGFDYRNQFGWLDIALEWEGDEPLVAKRSNVSDDLVRLVDAVAASGEPEGPVIAGLPPSALCPPPGVLPAALRDRPLVCVHPAAGTETRQWPLEHFAELIDLLVARHAVGVIIIGGPDEAELAATLVGLVRDRRLVVSLAGKIPLADLPSVIAGCALFVGNNSGPKHLAAGLGVPTIGVHSGMADVTEWAPLGPAALAIERKMTCAPCGLQMAVDCKRGLACLRQLGAGDVYRACRPLLALRLGAAGRVSV